ncbi:hypothetical protein Scep_030652 [Stephania cephalantha]|uniref:Uncharacterized protein n=1 Tax=Stephania cephalantha TaxID=152367 RepID=A0AAP0HH45_9MAGN
MIGSGAIDRRLTSLAGVVDALIIILIIITTSFLPFYLPILVQISSQRLSIVIKAKCPKSPTYIISINSLPLLLLTLL